MKIYVLMPKDDAAFAAAIRAAGAHPITSIPATLDGAPVIRGKPAPGAVTVGAMDRAAMKAAQAAGAIGIVLAEQTWLAPEAPLSADDRQLLSRLGQTDFATGSLATLPSGLKVGRDALLASFMLKRGGSIEGMLRTVRSDLGLPSPPPVSALPSAVAAPAPASPASAGAPVGEVLAKLTAIVSEKTGYPKELLDPNLDMEADLGIDTVKQAEIFGILRDSYQLPRDDNLKLKDYPTLAKVAEYIAGRAQGASSTSPSAAPAVDPRGPATALPADGLVRGPGAQAPAAPMAASIVPAVSGQFETVPPEEAVAIIGIGAVLPKANGKDEFWQNVLNKVDCIVEVPPERWSAAVHYDADPSKEDKTYAKIGGFITGFKFDALKFRIPPTTAKALDPVQQMALAAAAEALKDSGYDTKPFDRARCAVILGNSLGGELKDETSKRMHAAEFAAELRKTMPAADVERALASFKQTLPVITEDSMPGELSNVIAGRLANVLNLGGKNLTTDAACASSHAALDTAVKAILGGEADMVLCGGADRSMDPATYVKFCKIGALSATGSRPFDAGADGFVMGEGVAIFLLKRLRDAARDGDKIYAVVRGMGSSSDGKGKGITAPNPVGQKLAVERALKTAEIQPKHVQLVEAHGTSTKVGDVVEVEAIAELYKGLAPGSVWLGSVKSQIGHLKSAAGAAGIAKAALALHAKTLPPSINFRAPNPNIDWAKVPLKVITDAQPWPKPANGEPRRAAVSAFGFGGTNFHVILEEFLPEYHLAARPQAPVPRHVVAPTIEGDVVIVGADNVEGLAKAAKEAAHHAQTAATLEAAAQRARTPRAHLHAHRLGIGAQDRATLVASLEGAAALVADPKGRQALPLKVKGAAYADNARAGKIAFLFPGQGSQYANMCGELAKRYPVVRETFDEADAVLEPLIGAKLTSLLWVDPKDPAAVARAEESLRQTEVTQPAMLAADIAIYRVLQQHGVEPDMVAGHSLGEYAALVAAGVLSFKDALLAVSARGKEMANVHVEDKGLMASLSAGPQQVEEVLRGVNGYVVAANKNCPVQTVIAGASQPVKDAMELAKQKGIDVTPLNVSAAFHTSIVAPAAAPLRRVLERLDFRAPRIPVYTNVDATPYPNDVGVIRDILAKQIAAPVEWIAELEALHAAGARLFVEVGPKRALSGFVEATLQTRALAITTNHPKRGDLASFLDSLAKLGALGVELKFASETEAAQAPTAGAAAPPAHAHFDAYHKAMAPALEAAMKAGWEAGHAAARASAAHPTVVPGDVSAYEKYGLVPADVVVSGAAMGLPGSSRRVFSDDNADRLFAGENRIDRLDAVWATRFINKDITRLVKDAGEPRMERVTDAREVIKLAGRRGGLDVVADYGVDAKLEKTLDITSKLAIAAAYEALHDAGIPMVREQKRTSTGGTLPGHWALPAHMQDDTGIVFASAFPGFDNLVREVSRHLAHRYAKATLKELDGLYHELLDAVPAERRPRLSQFYAQHAHELNALAGDAKGIEGFSRHFLFQVLSLGHAELAESIHARGPNTQVNAACSSSTQAIAIAEDWLRAGRCRRVIVVGGDDVTSENLLEWIGSGFLASGAATTQGNVEDAALPFDKRRHGMIIGMGAVGIVLEHKADVEARGMVPVARLVATRIANSAFHGSRLHVEHIAKETRAMVETAARRLGVSVDSLGEKTVFVSHETYTPARGGSASAEAAAMRAAFGAGATKVLIANTKGFTGHPMGAGIEDALAVKALQFNKIPPIANLREVDPEFADLNLSRGGAHDRKYAVRFSAGFGSQLALAFFEKMADGPNRVRDAARYQSFLDRASGAAGAKAERVGRVLKITSAASTSAAPPLAMASPAPAPLSNLPQPAPLPIPVEAPKPIAPAQPAGPTVSAADVLSKVVALVGEKTGYPAEMLDPNLDMEADLGIDTVKQAEIFGILRDQFAIPREEGLTLKEYPTLAKVAGYMHSRMQGQLAAAVVAAPAPASPTTTAPAPYVANPSTLAPAPTHPAPGKGPGGADEVLSKVTAMIARKTGYPPEMLDPTLDMEADLGIDTVKQAEIFGEVREAFGIPRIEGINLKDYPTIRHVAGFVATHAGRASAAQDNASAAPIVTAPASGVVRRVPRVVGAHAEGHGARSAFVVGHGNLAEALRHRWSHPDGQIAIVVDDARGLFQFAKAHAARLESGALGILAITQMGGDSGIEKCAHPEQGGVTGMTKALAAEFPAAWIRALDLEEGEDVATRTHHVESELKIDKSRVEVGRTAKRRIVVETIDAGSPASARPQLAAGDVILVTGGARGITAEVLKSLAPQRPTLVLLGRTAAPTDADAQADINALKAQAQIDLAARGERVTPVAIEKWVAPYRAKSEAARSMQALRAAGATVEYMQCDVGDAGALVSAFAQIRARHPHIAGIIHAAGVEESKRLADKDDAAFERAWRPKAEAAMLLARLTERDRLKFFVMFGSVAGRFGNAAQADYSAANDAMSKLARALRAKSVPASVFCWGPWGEVGMATKGSTLTVLKSAGVEPMTTQEGVDAFLAELARLDEAEVVLAKGLGQIAPASSATVAAAHSAGPTVVTLRADEPRLDHHRVDGVPYLAGVLGLSLLAEAAPFPAVGAADVHFSYPVKLLRDAPVDATMRVGADGTATLTTIPPGPKREPRTHFTARLLREAPAIAPLADAPAAAWDFSAIYPPFFHGPAYQVLSHATRVGLDGIDVAGRAPAPGIGPLAALMEGAFQALGLWGLAVGGVMALPERVGLAAQLGAPDQTATSYRVRNARLRDGRVKGDIDCLSGGQVVVAMRDVSLIVTGPSPLAAPNFWASETTKLGEASIVRVPVTEARRLLERPELWARILGAQEQAALGALAVDKRREEWLAATLAGKSALRQRGDARPLPAIEILRGEDGAPRDHAGVGLTLSHAGGLALAHAFDSTRERCGVDVETIEPRGASFEEEAFTAEERSVFPQDASRPAALALAWAAKESVLKALGVGLSVDLHSVRLRFGASGAQVELTDSAKERFAKLDGERIRLEARREGELALAWASLTLGRRG